MNILLVIGGYNWTVVVVESRNYYIEALEEASVNDDVSEFAKFINILRNKQQIEAPTI